MPAGSREAKVKLVAETAQFRQQMAQAQRSVQDTASRIQAASRVAGAGMLALGAAATAAVSALQVRQSIDLLDQLGKLSERTGVSVESLSALRYAGQLADVSLETLSGGVRQLAIEMAKGNEAFARLGVATRDGEGNLRKTEDVLADLADKFSTMEDGAGKTAIAAQVLGRRYGPELLTMLNQGSRGLAAARREAEQLGQVVSGDAARAAAEFNDNMSKLQAAVGGLSIEVTGKLLPALTRLTGQLVDNIKHFGLARGAAMSMFEAMLGGTDTLSVATRRLGEVQGRVDTLEAEIADAVGRGNTARARRLDEELRAQQRQLLMWQQAVRMAREEAEQSARGPGAAPRTGAPVESDEDRRTREAAERAASQARERAAKTYADLIARIRERTEAAQRELDIGRALSEQEQFEIEVRRRLADAMGTLTDAQKRAAEAQIDEGRAIDARLRQARDLAEIRRTNADTDRQVRVASEQALQADIDAMVRYNQALEDQLGEIGRTAAEVDALRVARVRHTIAQEQEALVMARNQGASDAEIAARERRIRLLQREADLRETLSRNSQDQADLEAAVRAARERADRIQDSLGRGVLDVLEGRFDSIARKFKDMLVRMAADAVAADLADLILRPGGPDQRSGGWLGNILAAIFHTGGIAGAGGGTARAVSPLVFAGAPRMHKGGLAGDEVPAILRRGEEVLPSSHPRHRNNAGAGLSITIHSVVNAGAGTDAATLQRVLDARDEALKSDIADGMRRGRWGAVMA